MGLTKEQKAIRMTGIGASEAATVLEANPYEQPIDLYLEKIGKSEERHDTPATELGDALESGLRALYEKRSGIVVWKPDATFRHPKHPEILATPDGLTTGDEDGGLELKLVGFRMQHHWADDTVPDYVTIQAAQNMAVFDRAWWDVGRLIGTDFEIYRIERDLEFEEEMIASLVEWWADHVVARVPPPALDPDARRRWLRERYPGSESTACRKVDAFEIGEALRWLAWWAETRKTGDAAADAIELQLCELVGDDYGIEHEAGRFLWYPCKGSPRWKDIAHELAGGTISAELLEKHRGDDKRVTRLTMTKPKLPAKRPRARKV